MKQAEFAKMMAILVEKGDPFAVATVVKTEGSSIGKPGFKVVISGDGEVLYGSLGGVCPESAIVDKAKETMRLGSPKTVKVFLSDAEGALQGMMKKRGEDEVYVETNCGGMMEIYVEPYLPQQRLVLVGQGGKDDVEDVLVKLGKMLDFEVVVIDHSPYLTEEPDQLISDVDYDLASLKISETDSVVVLTKGSRDVQILKTLSKSNPRYVGLLASRQRAKDDMTSLKKEGVRDQFLDLIRAPAGADLGSVTPSEIALSIMAEVLATKHGKQVPRKSLTRDETSPSAT